MKRLPKRYQSIGTLNTCGGVLLFEFALAVMVSIFGSLPAPVTKAEALGASSVLGLIGLGFAFAGMGLRRGPQYWRATRVIIFVLAPVPLVLGLWLGWAVVHELLWGKDAQSGLAILFLPVAAALVCWSAVNGVAGVCLGRYLGGGVIASIEDRSATLDEMPQGKAIFIGLNQTGLICFILLLIFCLPLFWIPFLIDSCKGNPD